MALDDHSDQVVTKYVRRQFPELEDGIRRYIQDELQRIEQSISVNRVCIYPGRRQRAPKTQSKAWSGMPYQAGIPK